MIIQYPKIDSLYKRNDNGDFINEFSREEFQFLYNDVRWRATEKIDGTNIRLQWDNLNDCFAILGRKDKSKIPKELYSRLEEITQEIHPHMRDLFEEEGKDVSVVFFGEGYGGKIQSGKYYMPHNYGFILFDIWINGIWLQRKDVEEIAEKLNLDIVPIVVSNITLSEAEYIVANGFYSVVANNPEFLAEGLVLEPMIQLFDRRKRRIMTKIKTVDYKKD